MYLDSPNGLVKYGKTRKNAQRYYIPRRLIRFKYLSDTYRLCSWRAWAWYLLWLVINIYIALILLLLEFLLFVLLLLLFFRLVTASFNKLNKFVHDIIFFLSQNIPFPLWFILYPLWFILNLVSWGKTDNHFINFRYDPPMPSLISIANCKLSSEKIKSNASGLKFLL